MKICHKPCPYDKLYNNCCGNCVKQKKCDLACGFGCEDAVDYVPPKDKYSTIKAIIFGVMVSIMYMVILYNIFK